MTEYANPAPIQRDWNGVSPDLGFLHGWFVSVQKTEARAERAMVAKATGKSGTDEKSVRAGRDLCTEDEAIRTQIPTSGKNLAFHLAIWEPLKIVILRPSPRRTSFGAQAEESASCALRKADFSLRSK